jgi:4-hydroxythreonine-4-phosphate dehydrogenase
MGDPAGIGPEVVLKALADKDIRRRCRAIIVGDWGLLERVAPFARGEVKLRRWQAGEGVRDDHPDEVAVCSVSALKTKDHRPGRPSGAAGAAAFDYVRTAVQLIQARVASAMATAPINKKSLRLAGYGYPGHTEILAKLVDARDCRMMLFGKELKVVLVTGHLPLVRVSGALNKKGVRVTVELTAQALKRYFGIARPRIAVAGLNPHGGEKGLFGREEEEIIRPALRAVRERGIAVRGPLPADSLFHAAARRTYDAVVCMYHDQGLIPLKQIHFYDGVALTLGLPFIRTSVDHGTAYDIAGKNQADARSMKAAILLAARLAAARQPRNERG